MKDYPRWEEDEEEVKESASKAKKQIPTQEPQPTRKPDVSVYEAYDEFQEKHEIPENDESFFYGAAFDDFNKEWQGIDAGAGSVSTEFGTTNNSTDAEPDNEDEGDKIKAAAITLALDLATFENVCYLIQNGADRFSFIFFRGFGTGAMHVLCGLIVGGGRG